MDSLKITPLVELGRALRHSGYTFTTVTPETHEQCNSRPQNRLAKSLRDVFGWNRPFAPGILPPELVALLERAEAWQACSEAGLWRSTVRFSTLGADLLAHSAFPTTEQAAVFFGPDTYRFARAIRAARPQGTRAVDIGCGTGAAGILLRRLGVPAVVLADVNEAALDLARCNAQIAELEVDVVKSDVLDGVAGEVDLIVANPPYLLDTSARTYRHGGGSFGEGLGAQIVLDSLTRLAEHRTGGRLLVYTGAPIVDGEDRFLRCVTPHLQAAKAAYTYEELDPDVFGDELRTESYRSVERIAAVFLDARVTPRR